MRIMPACLYCYEKNLNCGEAVDVIHKVGSLTHAHIRVNIACGLYYFMCKAILEENGILQDRLQTGANQGFAYYVKKLADHECLQDYDRLRDLTSFAALPVEKIKSSGYVVDTLEAAVWSLLTTTSFEEALLKAVNLGEDTDTVGSVTGGLAGLYYRYEEIPAQWLEMIQKRNWIESLCDDVIVKPEGNNETTMNKSEQIQL